MHEVAGLRGDMERRIAPAIGRANVGAGIEQRAGGLGMAVGHGHHQQLVSRRQREIRIEPGRDQRARGRHIVSRDGKRERVEAALGHRFRIGANLEQRADDVGMSFGGRPHERGLPSTGLRDVHVRAMEHQLPHGLQVSSSRRLIISAVSPFHRAARAFAPALSNR